MTKENREYGNVVEIVGTRGTTTTTTAITAASQEKGRSDGQANENISRDGHRGNRQCQAVTAECALQITRSSTELRPGGGKSET